jgi:putative addiction module component (TIGR02574 family)
MSVQTVLDEALHLPPDQRLVLAERLWASVQESVALDPPEPDWQIAELAHRLQAHDRGELDIVAHEDVMVEIEREETRAR